MSSTARVWKVGGGRELWLDVPRVMGILNVTPDSFSDGGAHAGVEGAVRAAERMIAEGADVIDVGGESTRPGAERVSAAEQVRRVTPVIRELRRRAGAGAIISVDTTLSEVGAAALDAGADAVNDVSAGTEDEGMLGLIAEQGCGVVLMHRLAPPGKDVYSTEYSASPRYEGGVVSTVTEFLEARAEAARARSVARGAIVLDPGLGFGKSVEQNLELIEKTGEIVALGYPVLSGVSRKSFTAAHGGMQKGAPAWARLRPTLELSVAHLRAGAMIFRVHDVREHIAVLRKAWEAMRTRGEPRGAGGVI